MNNNFHAIFTTFQRAIYMYVVNIRSYFCLFASLDPTVLTTLRYNAILRVGIFFMNNSYATLTYYLSCKECSMAC